MKTLLAICMIITSTLVWADDRPATSSQAANAIKGEVLEVKQVESYTYLRLKTKDGETWAAVAKAQVKKGAIVTIDNLTVMSNFESKTLKQTFSTIFFGTLANSKDSAKNAYFMGSAFPAFSQTENTADAKVPKASGADARTVAEIINKAKELKDQPVLVSGKVVKYNPGIMGKNWVHLRDGSGSAANETNDILVTTQNSANVGDIVTAKGIVRTDKDFGAGYVYKVLIEEATLQ